MIEGVNRAIGIGRGGEGPPARENCVLSVKRTRRSAAPVASRATPRQEPAMLTDYEAAILTRQKAADLVPAVQRTVAQDRIGTVMVALSLLAAVGLLYSAFFSEQGHRSRLTQIVPATIATPVIHPAVSGHPEAALFI
jgi:hypothetical protein